MTKNRMKTFTFSTEQDSQEVESAHEIDYKIILFSIEVAGHKQMINFFSHSI